MAAISSALSGSSSSGVGDKYSSLTSGDFMKVMFAELTRQDPLQPSQTKDLLEQISVIRSIESNLSLTDDLKKMVKQSEVTSAGNLVGQTVKGTTDNGQPVEGVVYSVSVSRDGVGLNLDSGLKVQMKNVTEIRGFILPQGTVANP